MTRMKKLLVVLFVFVLGASMMVGCGGSSKTLEGKYRIVSYVTDGQDLIKLLNDAGISTDGIYLEFTKDGKFKMNLELMGESDSVSGSYVVSGKNLVFTTTDGGLDKATIDGNKITLEFEGDKLIFEK